jgi:hypothetical protein
MRPKAQAAPEVPGSSATGLLLPPCKSPLRAAALQNLPTQAGITQRPATAHASIGPAGHGSRQRGCCRSGLLLLHINDSGVHHSTAQHVKCPFSAQPLLRMRCETTTGRVPLLQPVACTRCCQTVRGNSSQTCAATICAHLLPDQTRTQHDQSCSLCQAATPEAHAPPPPPAQDRSAQANPCPGTLSGCCWPVG